MTATPYRDRLEAKLTQRLSPVRLEIEDESHRHAGHAGHRPGGETHFRLFIVAAAFAGLSRVARQRLVFDVVKEELAERVHALAMTTLAPGEPGANAAG